MTDTTNEPVSTRNLDRYSSAELPWSRPRDILTADTPQADLTFFVATVRPDGRQHSAAVGPSASTTRCTSRVGLARSRRPRTRSRADLRASRTSAWRHCTSTDHQAHPYAAACVGLSRVHRHQTIGGRAGIPGVLVHGRLDLSGSVDTASELDRAWRDGELVVLEDSGHRTSDSKRKALLDALYRFAARNAP